MLLLRDHLSRDEKRRNFPMRQTYLRCVLLIVGNDPKRGKKESWVLKSNLVAIIKCAASAGAV